jgi:hypothetical protein
MPLWRRRLRFRCSAPDLGDRHRFGRPPLTASARRGRAMVLPNEVDPGLRKGRVARVVGGAPRQGGSPPVAAPVGAARSTTDAPASEPPRGPSLRPSGQQGARGGRDEQWRERPGPGAGIALWRAGPHMPESDSRRRGGHAGPDRFDTSVQLDGRMFTGIAVRAQGDHAPIGSGI